MIEWSFNGGVLWDSVLWSITKLFDIKNKNVLYQVRKVKVRIIKFRLSHTLTRMYAFILYRLRHRTDMSFTKKVIGVTDKKLMYIWSVSNFLSSWPSKSRTIYRVVWYKRSLCIFNILILPLGFCDRLALRLDKNAGKRKDFITKSPRKFK